VPSLPFDESNTFTPPPAFGPYRVLHQIGSGVLGPVFRTYDPQADRLVAVKAFRLDLLPEDVARLADGLRRLVGTAGYLAAGLEGTTAYVAMEYHAAETFDVALRHLAPAPLETAVPILRSLAEAIDAAWAAGPAFGHGALHPRDVFVTPGTDAVRVTGFGIAPALEAIGARPPVRRPYTAPERAFGEGWDQRADVFSLGAIAHELLTGRRPAGPGEQDGSLPASLPPELRVQIRRVLSKALAESPAHRFGSAREFIATLTDRPLVESDPLSRRRPIAAFRHADRRRGPTWCPAADATRAGFADRETTQTEEASDDAPRCPPTPAASVRTRADLTPRHRCLIRLCAVRDRRDDCGRAGRVG
jgi:serine/threonine-protein kinase